MDLVDSVLFETDESSYLAPGATQRLRVNGLAGVPETGTDKVKLLLEAFGSSSGSGELRVLPSVGLPASRALTVTPNQTTASGEFLTDTVDGAVSIENASTAPIGFRLVASGYVPNGEDQHGATWSVVVTINDAVTVTQNLATGATSLTDAETGAPLVDDGDPGFEPIDDGSPNDIESTEDSSSEFEMTDLESIDADADVSAGGIRASTENATDVPFTTMRDTPSGYKFRGGTRVDGYRYNAGATRAELHRTVNGVDRLQGTVKVNLIQRLVAGTSANWTMELVTATDGQSLYDYNAYYEYWCGVNVPLQSDYTCDELDDDAIRHYGPKKFGNSVSTRASVTHRHRFAFNATNKRQYPLVNAIITWPGTGVRVDLKSRGWDIVWSSGSRRWLLARDAK